MIEPSTEAHDTRSALGVLLSFFRRRKGISQKDLANMLESSPSSLAMIESGSRTSMSKELLLRLISKLGLNEFESEELLKTAGFSNRDSLIDRYAMKDVLLGTPVFLRSLEEEARFQSEISLPDEIWVVAKHFFDLDQRNFYDTVKYNIEKRGVRYVYFQEDEHRFDVLKSRLEEELEDPTKLQKQVQCILAPPTMFFFAFAVYNPGKPGGMFGRLTILDRGIPIGLLTMDVSQLRDIYLILREIYDPLQTRREINDTRYGKFKKYYP